MTIDKLKSNKVIRGFETKIPEVRQEKTKNLQQNKQHNKNQNIKENKEKKDYFLKDIETNFPIFKEYTFFIIDLINHYLSSVFKRTIYGKNTSKDFKYFVFKKYKEEFGSNIKEIDLSNLKELYSEIDNKLKSKNNFYNRLKSKNNFHNRLESIKSLFKDDDIKSNNDFLLKPKLKYFEEFYNNYDKKYEYDTILNCEFILYVKDFIDFINKIRDITNKRHYIEHENNTNYDDKKFLEALFVFLPEKYIYEFFSEINKYNLKLENKIDVEKYKKLYDDPDEENDDSYIKQYKIFKNNIFQNALSKKKYLTKQNHNNKKYRKYILQGITKKGETKWKIRYNNYKILHERPENNKFYKITTFKKLYFFISEENIEKIEQYLYNIAQTKQDKIKYKFLCFDNKNEFAKKIIKFSYIENFYFSLIDINFLLNKTIYFINDYYKNIGKKYHNEDLKKIRNKLKHNNLFCFMKNEEDFVIKTILEALDNIKKDMKNKKMFSDNCLFNNFIIEYTNILNKLKLPVFYDKQHFSKLKVYNSAKLRKSLKNKKNYIVDNQLILKFAVNNLLKILEKNIDFFK